MLKTLFKIKFVYLLNSMFGRSLNRKKKASPMLKIGIVVLAIYIICAICMFFGMTYSSLAIAFIPNGLSWLYFSLAGIFSAGLCFIGSIFTAQTQLFEAKDNELLLSMPIPPSYIVASRFLSMAVFNYASSALVTIPALVVYGIYAPITPLILLNFIVASLLLPFIPLTLSCVAGWAIAAISSKMRRKNIISVVFMIVFFLGYMFLYTNLKNYMQELIKNGEAIGSAIKTAIPPIYYYGTAIANSNMLNIFILALWCIIPFAILYFLISKTFIEIATSKKGFSKKAYKEKQLTVSGTYKSLFKKELSRFLSLPIYIFNSGLGVVIILLFSGFVAIEGKNFISKMPAEFQSLIVPGLCFVLCGCAIMTSTTSASLSLEGKNFWIIKSMPISAKQIYLAKLSVNLIISIPAIFISALVCTIFLKLSILDFLFILLLPTIVQVFSALFGLMANIKFPRFEWINETAAIKQSGSVLLSILGGMVIIAVPAILFFVLLSVGITPTIFLVGFGAIMLIINIILYRWLMTKGANIYTEMN